MNKLLFFLMTFNINMAYAASLTVAQNMFDHGNFTEAISIFKELCDSGDSSACSELSFCYEHGRGTNVEKNKAEQYYLRALKLDSEACDHNTAKACYLAGYAYGTHESIKDLSKSLNLKTKACQNNYIHACVEILNMTKDTKFKFQHNVAQNLFNKSLLQHQLDCKNGIANSCYDLGKIYYEGIVTMQDKSSAQAFFTKACDLGTGEICNKIALALGYDTNLSLKSQDLTYFQKACDKNNSNGCFQLGLSYKNGYAVQEDKEKAYNYYQKGCDLNGFTCYQAAESYMRENNLTAAVNFYQRGCDKFNGSSCYKLGDIYHSKYHNDQTAVILLEKGCEIGDKDSCKKAGYFYQHYSSLEGTNHYLKALKNYTKSCMLEDNTACLSICELYDKGDQTIQNDEKAFSCYQNICLNSLYEDEDKKEACLNMGVSILRGKNMQIDYKQAFQIFTKYNQKVYLGEMYENGFYVKKDLNKALSYYAQDHSDESKQNYSRLEAQLKHYTQLFGISLIKTSRNEMQNAIHNTKAKIIREDEAYWGDLYDTSELLKDSTELYIAYTSGNKFALAKYVFPSKLDPQQIENIKNMVIFKYGLPNGSQGNPSVGKMQYVWHLKDGIEIKVSRKWPDTTTYMTYTYPKNYARVLEEQKLQETKKKVDQYKVQNNAF